MIRKILNTKDARLRAKSGEVASIDKKVRDIITDLKDTLYAQKDPEGVGLAAPQIGKNVRIFLMSHEGLERVVINPKITSIAKTPKPKKSSGKKEILEGCLSLPHYYGPLKRSPKITMEYTNEKGKRITETFTGFMAQIVQHEIDHLEGVLFIDHIIAQKKELYKVVGDEWEEVELT